MSRRWWIAGVLLALVAFIATLGGGVSNVAVAGLPVVLHAAINAVSVLVAVWVYETIYRIVRATVRVLMKAGARSGGSG